MKYIALINDCRQYSEDAWESCPKIKDISPETTIQELIDWHNDLYKRTTFNKETKACEYEFPEFLRQIHIIQKSNKRSCIGE